MRVTFVRAALLGTVAAAALITTPALAQENPDTSPSSPSNQQTENASADASEQTIVVTARRRNELLLDVPVAVTAYSGEQLDRQGALDITDIADTTPNVTLEVSRGTNSTLTPFIRGIGQQDPVAGFEQGVGLYLDDVYLNRPQAAVLDIYDVERIEVLRGPQGTLYGRNTVGGAIKYVTRRIPTDGPHAMVRTNVGTHGQFDAIAQVSSPLTQSLRIAAAVARLSNTGFGRNLTTGDRNYNKDVWAARGTLELEPAADAFFRLSGDYTWDNSNPRGGHRLIANLVTGELPLGNVFDSEGALVDPKQKVRSGGISLHGEIGLTDWLKFRTITAYRKDRSDTPIDFDATPAVDVDVPAIYKNHQFSQELQLVADKGPLQGVAGFYYLNASAFDVFDVRLYTTLPAVLPGLTAATVGDVKTRTWAAFSDLTYNFSPQWAASVGLRYTNDHRHANVFRRNLILGGSPELGGSDPFDATGVQLGSPTSEFDGSRTDKAVTPRLSVNFKPTPNHNLYVSYSRGFKGGGFDPRGLTTQAPSQDPKDIYDFMAFDPEKVDSYEAGWKASLFGRRLQLATAIFDAEYKDVQVPGSSGCIVNGVATFCGITTNAGKARFRGVEVETNARVAQDFAALGDRLNLSGTLGYLDAKYRQFITNIPGLGPVDVAKDRKIQNTPKWTLSGTLDYETPLADGRLDFNTTVSYRSASQQFELRTPMLDQPGFSLWDANLVWRSRGNRYEIGLHGKNLLNKKYIVAGYNFLAQDPFSGNFILNGGKPVPTLGTAGVLTAYYGNPRQVFLSAAVNF
ncbi:MAG TPA: TonB-dependent receptor [Sphingomicrobium sp.]|nr:TonB-dependent receptor [Sphingomicrobium sp.]